MKNATTAKQSRAGSPVLAGAASTENATMTRKQAAAIAKDLVEGGINANGTTKLTAEAHSVCVQTVRRIKAVLLRNTVAFKPGNPGYSRIEARQLFNASLCTMVDAIENGWEDAALNLKG